MTMAQAQIETNDMPNPDLEGQLNSAATAALEIPPDLVPPPELDVAAELLDAEAAAVALDDGTEEWIAPWVVSKVIALRARAAAAKESYVAVTAGIQHEENLILAKYGAKFRVQIECDLKGTKKKTFNYPTGKAGLKKRPDRLEVVDEKAAIEWADIFEPDFIKRLLTGKPEMKKRIAKGQEIPGVQVVHGVHGVHVDGKLLELPSEEQQPGSGYNDRQIRPADFYERPDGE